MIEMLNRLSGEWGNYLLLWLLQNTLFVGIVLVLLYAYRRRHPYFLRWIALLGLAKLLLPPIPGGQWLVDSPLSLGILNFPTLNLAPITVTAGAAATLSLPGMVLLAWSAGIVLLLLLALRRHFHLRKILKSLRNFERAAAFIIDQHEVENAGVVVEHQADNQGHQQFRFTGAGAAGDHPVDAVFLSFQLQRPLAVAGGDA